MFKPEINQQMTTIPKNINFTHSDPLSKTVTNVKESCFPCILLTYIWYMLSAGKKYFFLLSRGGKK